METGSQAGAVAVATNAGECLLDRKGASAFLKEKGYRVAEATLAKLASLGGGPRYRKFGKRPIYTPSDLLEWAESRCSAPMHSTSAPESRKAR
jgi:hypothetical protein